jgi:S-DNA-T family DNA segregation ATPase FtsK/SpoIIIE
MTELNQTNGSGPANGHGPLIPGQRTPQDTVPPGVWRGSAPTDTTAPAETPQSRTRLRTTVRRVVTHPRTRTAPVSAAKGVAWAVRHRNTRRAARLVVRQGAYVLIGGKVTARRTWDARTTARHQRLMRAAEAANDHQAVRELAKQAEEHRQQRHERRMALLQFPVIAARSLVYAAGGLFALGILIAISSHHLADVIRPLMDVSHAIRWSLATAAALAHPIATYGPWAALLALWAAGRAHAAGTSGWTSNRVDGDERPDSVLTADAVVRALRALGIEKIARALKDGWVPNFHLPPVMEGPGYRTIFSLPEGVAASMLMDKRELLGRNLGRTAIETWPSDAALAKTGPVGYVDLWMAHRGELDKPAPAYPLQDSGVVDVFEGVPVGVSARREPIVMPIVGVNHVFGGWMGQGKSNAARVAILGAALDPLCELRVFVFAGNGDFDAYTPRLSQYVRGVDDDHVQAGLTSLQKLYAEVARRETRLAQLGAKKLTRKLASEHADLRPLVVLYSECHVLFGHKEHGEMAADLAANTMRRARKTGITLMFDTQSARNGAIPKKVLELITVNTCFAVKSWQNNDGFLGDGSFQAGIRATELRMGVDRGKSLTTGVTDAKYEILGWYFIEVNDDTGYDAAEEVIERAMGKVAKGTPVQATATIEPEERRDLLEDLDEVLGRDPIPAADVPPLLRKLAPTWLPYVSLTGRELVKQLAARGVKVPSTANRWPVDPVAVRSALANQSTKDLDDQAE